MKIILAKLRQYQPLIKSLQTGLLVTTGVAGYMSAHAKVNIPLLLVMSASLTAVSSLANLSISLMRNYIPGKIRIMPASSGL